LCYKRVETAQWQPIAKSSDRLKTFLTICCLN